MTRRETGSASWGGFSRWPTNRVLRGARSLQEKPNVTAFGLARFALSTRSSMTNYVFSLCESLTAKTSIDRSPNMRVQRTRSSPSALRSSPMRRPLGRRLESIVVRRGIQ